MSFDAAAGASGAPAAAAIAAFRIAIPQGDLDDLRHRLVHTRWPDELPDAGGAYGVPLGTVRALAEYWLHEYDWRRHEAELNRLPQFTTTIDGQRVHFIHVRSRNPDALPLVITHGWPGSVAEFTKIIDPLVDPAAHGGESADSFHLVIPSIPGFGFSGPTTSKGWDPARVSRAWKTLMEQLGYQRYGAQGGDFGSRISRDLGRIAADRVVGVHLNLLSTPPTGDPAQFDDEERLAAERLKDFKIEKSGYQRIQARRPQTLAYALADSPIGLLAWIAERFIEWTDPTSAIHPDDLLTDVSIYWLTNTAGSAARLYWEAAHSAAARSEPSPVPTGLAVFPYEVSTPIRAIAEKTDRIVHWSRQPRGGHFAALEAPDLLVADIRTFFRPLR